MKQRFFFLNAAEVLRVSIHAGTGTHCKLAEGGIARGDSNETRGVVPCLLPQNTFLEENSHDG